MEGRILAVDFGTKRLGVAVSDALGLTAQGLPTLDRTNLLRDLAALRELAKEYGVREIIVGNPLSADGSPNEMSRRAAVFARKLGEQAGLPVTLWDERLSSAEANRVLRGSGASLGKRRRAVDRLAAVLILQNYLDWRGASHSPPF